MSEARGLGRCPGGVSLLWLLTAGSVEGSDGFLADRGVDPDGSAGGWVQPSPLESPSSFGFCSSAFARLTITIRARAARVPAEPRPARRAPPPQPRCPYQALGMLLL